MSPTIRSELSISRVRLPGLSPRAYEHPADRGALAVLRAVPGVADALKALAGAFPERGEYLLTMASCIRVGPTQYPTIEAFRRETAAIIDLDPVPEVFIQQSPEVNAYAIGIDQPFVVLTTGLVELMDPEALRHVVGHEMGHILSEHAVLRTMLFRLLQMRGLMSAIPAGVIGLRVVLAALLEWFRKAELTADRAGLLATQDPAAALRAHAYLAGATNISELDLPAFLAQAEEYLGTQDVRDLVHKLRNLELLSHPLAVVRAAELQRWAASPEYRQLLGGDYQRRAGDHGAADLGEDLAAAARSYKDGAKDTFGGLVTALNSLGEQFTKATKSRHGEG